MPFEEHKSAIRALDAATGKMRWEFTLLTPPLSGVLATAGNLVFTGSEEGLFFALDAGSGRLLWSQQLGGAINANPISYSVDGQQYIAIAADSVFYVFGLPAVTSLQREQLLR